MQNSSKDNIILHKLTYEKTQYKTANLSLIIASSIYIIAVLISIGSHFYQNSILDSLRFKLLFIFCLSIIVVDLFFYFLDSSSKNLKYIITTWYSIIYFIALITLQSTTLFYSVIFLLLINLMYINIHITYVSGCIILFCNTVNIILLAIKNNDIYNANIRYYYLHMFFIFIASALIVMISYILRFFYRNSIIIMQQIFSEEEHNKIAIKEHTKQLKLNATKVNKSLNYLESTITTYKKTTLEITNISRNVSKTSRILSNISQNLKKNCHKSTELTSTVIANRDELNNFINTHLRNLKHLEDFSKTTTASLENADCNLEKIKQLNDELKSTVKKISSLSSQTNLLTINASIESARTGTDKSGFDIVIEQLRSLTDDIHVATNNMSSYLSDIEYYTNIVNSSHLSALEAGTNETKLITLSKNDTELINKNLDALLGHITNLSNNVTATTTYSDNLIVATSKLTPAITNIRSSAIDNSTSGTKACDLLETTKINIHAILECISNINSYLN